MPTVIFSERDFMKDIISGVTSPRGMVRVPSTSKRAMMRGLAGVIFCLFGADSSDIVGVVGCGCVVLCVVKKPLFFRFESFLWIFSRSFKV